MQEASVRHFSEQNMMQADYLNHFLERDLVKEGCLRHFSELKIVKVGFLHRFREQKVMQAGFVCRRRGTCKPNRGERASEPRRTTQNGFPILDWAVSSISPDPRV